MNTASFYKKFILDMEDSQYKNGLIPAVMPFSQGEMMYKNTGGSVGWADAIYLMPYRFYKMYGDTDILKRYYPMMKKYVEYVLSHMGHKDKKAGKADPYNQYVYEKGMHLGEWLEPKEYNETIAGSTAGKLVRLEEATAYAHLTFATMEEIANILGKSEDDKVDDLAKRLAESTHNRNYCVGTGFLSTVFLLKALSENGYVEEAYKTLENEKAPGWLSEVVAGATTVWESWDCNRHFTICPKPGGTFTFAKGSYRSIYGEVKVSWEKKTDGTYSYEISLPANTTATVILDGETKECESGNINQI